MTDVSQVPLNNQLLKFCNLYPGTFHHVLVLNPNQPAPEHLDGNTIYIQSEGRNLRAYWSEEGQLREQSFPKSKSRTISRHLPEEGLSENKKLLKKLISVLDLPNKPNVSFMDEVGNCNGWGFLYACYTSLGREEEFYALRRYIAKWDGKDKFPPLKEPLSYNYRDGEQLFEQTVNDLAWFQHSTSAFQSMYGKETEERIAQKDRKQQYSMLRLPENTLTEIFFYDEKRPGMVPDPIPDDTFVQMLDLYRHWGEGWIDLSIRFYVGNEAKFHALSAYITSEGKIKYFDSNINGKANIVTPERCLAQIKEMYGENTSVLTANINKFHNFRNRNVINEHETFSTYDERFAKLILKKAVGSEQVDFTNIFLRDYIKPIRSRNLLNEMNIFSRISSSTSTKMIQTLLNFGADINKPGYNGVTPLHEAFRCGNNTVALYLIENGANVNQTDNSGMTPLHYAVIFGNSAVVGALIAKSCDPMAVDKSGSTPLHHAARSKNLSALSALLKAHPININAIDNLGNTALHNAVRIKAHAEQKEIINQVAVIHLLRDHGADLKVKNNEGEKPFDIASNRAGKHALGEIPLKRMNALGNLSSELPRKSKIKTPLKTGRRPSQEENIAPSVSNNLVAATSGATNSGPIVKIGKITKGSFKNLSTQNVPSSSSSGSQKRSPAVTFESDTIPPRKSVRELAAHFEEIAEKEKPPKYPKKPR